MADRYLSTIYRIVSDVTGQDITLIDAQSRFSDFVENDEYHEVYERCCEGLDVWSDGIYNSMPVYPQDVSGFTLNSWRNLAPFSAKAGRLLSKFDVPIEDETMASLAETMRQGVYVSSGKYRPTANTPRSRFYVLAWSSGFYVAAVVVPYLLTLLPCNPICSDCTVSSWSQLKEILPYSLGFATVLNGIAILPGLIVMRHKRMRKLIITGKTAGTQSE